MNLREGAAPELPLPPGLPLPPPPPPRPVEVLLTLMRSSRDMFKRFSIAIERSEEERENKKIGEMTKI